MIRWLIKEPGEDARNLKSSQTVPTGCALPSETQKLNSNSHTDSPRHTSATRGFLLFYPAPERKFSLTFHRDEDDARICRRPQLDLRRARASLHFTFLFCARKVDSKNPKLENITIAKIITKSKMMHEQTKNQLV